MSWARLRIWRFAPLLGLMAIGPEPSIGESPQRASTPGQAPPISLFDPRLEALRRASTGWERREGLDRAVVDQVCLVPDFPTFLEAIATWDRGHSFPILFDDVESSFRFIRAFKPARVVRFPKASATIPRGKLWDRAIAAVGASWSAERSTAEKLPGDAVPRSLGPTPPGAVVSSPEAPMLAGAVALAAGRFQPMIRLDSVKRYADVLSDDEVLSFDRGLTSAIRSRIPNHDTLGDDCDFITIAGDWPYRYRDSNGEVNAVDDRVGRSIGSEQRWAYAGRLMGDATESVYRAMCSLFLQPESALMFNGYDEDSAPWSGYSMRTAAQRLSAVLPTSQVAGDRQAGIDGWHETFDPLSQYGLVLINSHGSPTVFNLRGGPAAAADIPRSIPSIVLMIHSYSAADPADPSTVAGRWLANGAFLFFGSVNEPYLDAFRTPRLVGDLIGEKVPVVAAVRETLAETRGRPWRLIFLGDPLYRLSSKIRPEPRLATWEPSAGWPAYREAPRPAAGTDAELLIWALKSAIARPHAGETGVNQDDLVEVLLGLNRGGLPASYRPVHDALLVEVLLQARKRGALRSKIASIPEADRSPALRRSFETLLAIEFHFTLSRGDATKARAAWSEVIRSDASREFKEQATGRIGRLANSPTSRADWAEVLRQTLRDRSRSPEADSLAAELKRVEEAMKADRATLRAPRSPGRKDSCRKTPRSSGPTPPGTRSEAAPRSAPDAPTVTPRHSPSDSEASPAIPMSRASTSDGSPRNSRSRSACRARR